MNEQTHPVNTPNKPRFQLLPNEVIAICVTLILTALIIMPHFVETGTKPAFQSSDLSGYKVLGKSVYAYTKTGQQEAPFHSEAYYMAYEGSSSDSEQQRVKDVFQFVVPKLHALADRHNDYYESFIYPDGYFKAPILEHGLPSVVTPFVYDASKLSDPSNKPLTNLRTLNQSLNAGPIEISGDLYTLLSIGLDMSIKTNSAFNMFVGTLSEFWNQQIDLLDNDFPRDSDPANTNTQAGRDNRELVDRLTSYIPISESALRATLTLSGNATAGYFADFKAPGVAIGDLSITLGGIAKGYANDVITTLLEQEELTRGFLYGAASSIDVVGNYIEPSAPWKLVMTSNALVSKENGYNADAFGLTYNQPFSISTSGGDSDMSYYYYTDDAGRLYHRHHIIDVHTGEPANFSNVDISVFSTTYSSARLDALTTALMCLSRNDGLALLNKLRTQEADATDLKGAWLHRQGTTPTFKLYAEPSFLPLLTRLNYVDILNVEKNP